MDGAELPVVADLFLYLLHCLLFLLCCLKVWVQLLVKLGSDLLLEELEVFAKDFDTKAVKVDGLTHGLLHTGGLLLHLSVL